MDLLNGRILTRILTATILTLLALAPFGCTSAPGPNSNATATNANSNASAAATANANTSAASSPFSVAEPERYSLKMTISGSGEANNRQGAIPAQEIEFARMDAKR